MPLLEFLPDSDGDLAQWAGKPSGPAWQAVQDFDGQDEDATFAAGGADGDVLLIRAGSLPSIPRVRSVAWVGLRARCRWRTPGNPGAIAPVIRSGLISAEGPVSVVDSVYGTFGGYGASGWFTEWDPDGGVPWTFDRARSAQVGIVDRSGPDLHTVRCTLVRKLIWVEYESRQAACRMWP